MIVEKIESAINFVREARDESDSIGESVMVFIGVLLVVLSVVTIAFMFIMLVFMIPRVFLPIYIGLFVAWKGYQRL